MRPRLTLLFDTEDPFNDHADDAAKAIAQVFTRAGARGTFCVTGEKCRKLIERGRRDVIEALGSHALGLHTNTHSIHPTTMELLEDKGWEDGCALALAAEQPGLEAFERAFGRKPCCWAGAGFTWGPQITAILPGLGVPATVYALTVAPGLPVHRFLGSMAFPLHHFVSETNWFSRQGTEQIASEVKAVLTSWTGVLCGHPTRLRYNHYWDQPFYAGATPLKYEGPDPRTEAEFEQTLDNLGWFLRDLAEAADIVGLDEALELPWAFTSLSDAEHKEAERLTVQRIRAVAAAWPVHRTGLTTRAIEGLTTARLDTLEVGRLIG